MVMYQLLTTVNSNRVTRENNRKVVNPQAKRHAEVVNLSKVTKPNWKHWLTVNSLSVCLHLLMLQYRKSYCNIQIDLYQDTHSLWFC